MYNVNKLLSAIKCRNEGLNSVFSATLSVFLTTKPFCMSMLFYLGLDSLYSLMFFFSRVFLSPQNKYKSFKEKEFKEILLISLWNLFSAKNILWLTNYSSYTTRFQLKVLSSLWFRMNLKSFPPILLFNLTGKLPISGTKN